MTQEEESKATMNKSTVHEEEQVIQAHQQLEKPKLRWIPLESNPDVRIFMLAVVVEKR